MVLLPDLSNTCHVTAKVYLVQLEHLSQAPQCEFVWAFPEKTPGAGKCDP